MHNNRQLVIKVNVDFGSVKTGLPPKHLTDISLQPHTEGGGGDGEEDECGGGLVGGRAERQERPLSQLVCQTGECVSLKWNPPVSRLSQLTAPLYH